MQNDKDNGSRPTRTLSTLIKSGVTILAALDIVGKTSGNKLVEHAIENVRANVREGESVAEPLARSKIFPHMVTRMVSVGEQTGELGGKPGSHISRGYSGDDLRAHIVIGCVDTRAARAAIRDAVSKWSTVSYWLDLGNNADSGQFILGEPLNQRNRRAKLRLRAATELYPEIGDPSLDNDGEPSCSAVESLEHQEPFVNSTLAQHALALLARLFRYGKISYHGGFINLATGATSVLRIDPQYWKRARHVSRLYSRLHQS